MKSSRRHGVIAGLVLLTLAPANVMGADEGGLVETAATGPSIRRSLEGVQDSTLPPPRLRQAAAPSVTPPALRRSLGRKILGGLLGGAAGVALGYTVGAHLEGDCHCDDPGLKGGLWGAGIGLVAGGVVGVVLASR